MENQQSLATGIQEGLRLQRLGRTHDALAVFQSLSLKFPQSEVCWNNLGQLAYANNFLPLAREALSRCVSINPKNARAWCRLGDCLRDAGLYEQALEPYKHAIRVDPNISVAHTGIGKAYLAVSDYDKCVKHHRIARSLAKSRLEKDAATVDEAYAFAEAGDTEKAQSVLSAVHDLSTNAGASGVSIWIDVLNKNYDQARDRLTPTLLASQHPIVLRCAIQLAELDKTDHAQHWARMLGDLVRSSPHEKAMEAAGLLSALARLHDRLGDYEKAFSFAQEGHKITLASRGPAYRWNEAGDVTLIQSIDHANQDEALAKNLLDKQIFSTHDSGSHIPVFIVGMPRSGTSLIEQTLASHAKICAGGELTIMSDLARQIDFHGRWPESIIQLSRLRLEKMAESFLKQRPFIKRNQSHLTDKMPHNFLHLGLIAAIFPQAKIIHTRRDPRDICLSIYFNNFSGGHTYAHDLRDLARHYANYEAIMYRWQAILPKGMILHVEYEAMARNHAEETGRIVRFLGLEDDANTVNFFDNPRPVLTASRFQVVSPAHTKSIGKWMHYIDYLRPLTEELNNLGVKLP